MRGPPRPGAPRLSSHLQSFASRSAFGVDVDARTVALRADRVCCAPAEGSGARRQMQTTDPMVRGYAIPASARFIRGDESMKSRLAAETLAKVSKLAVWKAPHWLPRQDAIELWRLVDQVSPDEETAYQNLVRLGLFI